MSDTQETTNSRIIACHRALAIMHGERCPFIRSRHRDVQRLLLIRRERQRVHGFHPKIGISKRIIAIAADASGVTVSEMLGDGQHRACVTARWVAAWVMKEHTRFSSTNIGRRLGGRDHSTILHGFNRVRADLATGGAQFGAIVNYVQARLR